MDVWCKLQKCIESKNLGFDPALDVTHAKKASAGFGRLYSAIFWKQTTVTFWIHLHLLSPLLTYAIVIFVL